MSPANTIQINLNARNSELASSIARVTRKSPEQLVNEVFAKFADEAEKDEQQKFAEWREAMLQIEGMWADRDDLPDFEEIRRSLDRDLWSK